MWFWIAVTAFFLIVFLVTKAVVRSQGGIHHVGLEQGYDVSLSGAWSGTGGGLDGLRDAGVGGAQAVLRSMRAGVRATVGAGEMTTQQARRHSANEVPRRTVGQLAGLALIAVLATSGLTGCSSSTNSPSSSSASSTAIASGSTPALGSTAWPAVPAQALPPEVASTMEAEVRGWVEKELLPGVTVAVVSPLGVWTVAAGADGDGTALQPNSGMALASITKTFTAAEVLLLAERGQLDLDAPASTYVDQAALANGTTVRQLLAHRSSIAEGLEAAYAPMMSDLDTPWSTKQVLAPVPTPTAAPGRKFSYVNANYILLGLVIEKVTGLDPAAAFTRDLWQPLGLTRVAYQDQQTLPPPLARPGADEELPNGTPHQPYLPSRSMASAFGAAGGVAADAETTARWGYALYGSRLLKPGSVAQMTDFGDGDGYGLGTMDFSSGRFSHATLEAVGHLGVLPGYRTLLAVFPATATSIAILTPSTVDPAPYVKWLVAAGNLATIHP